MNDNVLDIIVEKARGNPLFSIEMGAALVESDAIEIKNKTITLKSAERYLDATC
jgi:predicted ATPase